MESYARWTTKKELINLLTKVNPKEKIKNSGIVMDYDSDNLYLDTTDASTLVIGGQASGKSQTISLPLIKSTCLAEESIIINDVGGFFYENTSKEFINNNYDVKVINFSDVTKTNYYNPLALPYLLYKEGNKDKALELIENLSYYIFKDEENTDSFWINSSRDYFTGIVLYLFENAKEEEINLSSVYSLSLSLNENKKLIEEINSLDKLNSIYIYLTNIISAPKETKGGIVATFTQNLTQYIAKENLSNMLSSNDIDLTSITKNKTAIYIINKTEQLANNLASLLINQLIEATIIYGKKERRLNILLDEFNNLAPICNLSNLINYTRSLNMRFTILLNSYIELKNKYGKEESELIKYSCSNIIYLLAKDDYTLEEISKLCGNQNSKSALITKEELKTLKLFEAIILKTRVMPIKTKLKPDYLINWNIDFSENKDYPQTILKEKNVYTYE